MNKKTRYLYGILLTIGIGMIFMWYMCCNPDTQNPQITIQENKEDVTPVPVIDKGFTFKDPDSNGTFTYTSNDNFYFSVSGYTILTPVSQGVTIGIPALQAYLKSHPEKSIAVTGHYAPDEKNSSAFPNLGMARANAIKNYMTTKGILSQQINIFGEEDNSLIVEDDSYKDAARYQLSENNTNEAQALEALKKRVNENPLILYFQNGATSIEISIAQRQKIADISRYLDRVEDATITIEGHTDNSGGRITNTSLGKKRAEYLKGYFIENGIPDAKIITASKGPDEPIASNETPEGQAKNRRSVVTIN